MDELESKRQKTGLFGKNEHIAADDGEQDGPNQGVVDVNG